MAPLIAEAFETMKDKYSRLGIGLESMNFGEWPEYYQDQVRKIFISFTNEQLANMWGVGAVELQLTTMIVAFFATKDTEVYKKFTSLELGYTPDRSATLTLVAAL
jgi:hypothetical protein